MRNPFKRKTQDRDLFNIGNLVNPTSYSGMSVTTDSAQRMSAVWACIRLLCDIVATLPIHSFTIGSRVPIDPSPLILTKPAADTLFHEWIAMIMRSLLTAGNAWGLIIERNGGALRPSQIELLAPHRVSCEVRDSKIIYRLDGQEIDKDDLWHMRGYPLAGEILGLSPIGYAMQSIGVGLAAEKFGAQFFGESGIPSAMVTFPKEVKAAQVQEFRKGMDARLTPGRRGTIYIGGGADYHQVSVSPNESQFLETQRFSIQQVCRIYGVPPECIAAVTSGQNVTYANLEQRGIDLLTYGVNPWLIKLEMALNDLVPRGQYVKFNSSALVRPDLATRYASYATALEGGWLTLAEVRELEDRPPLPEEDTPAIESPPRLEIAS